MCARYCTNIASVHNNHQVAAKKKELFLEDPDDGFYVRGMCSLPHIITEAYLMEVEWRAHTTNRMKNTYCSSRHTIKIRIKLMEN